MNVKERLCSAIVLQIVTSVSLLNAPVCWAEEGTTNLTNILKLNVEEGTSIFFLDTAKVSEEENSKISIKARAACSIESAARLHANRTVYLLYTFPGYIGYRRGNEFDAHIKTLLGFKNVVFGYINVPEYTMKTPVEDLIRRHVIELSVYKVLHYSDLLRLVTLWRYGGIYLDNDVLALKSFDKLERNFVGAESNTTACNAVLGFQDLNVREYTLSWMLSIFNKSYKPDYWSANGPVLLTQ